MSGRHAEQRSTAPATARRLARQLLRWGAVTLSLASVLFFAVGPHVLDYRPLTVLSGSMAPGLPVGAEAIAVAEPTDDVAVGQVVAFSSPVDPHETVSHRVIRRRELPDGSVVVQTKGDANPVEDPFTTRLPAGVVYRLRYAIPYLGFVPHEIERPALRWAILRVIPALLLLLLLAKVWRRPRSDRLRTV